MMSNRLPAVAEVAAVRAWAIAACFFPWLRARPLAAHWLPAIA